MGLLLALVGLFVLPDPWRFILLGAAVTVEAAEIYVAFRIINRWRVKTGTEGMLGERAEVIGDCAPEGLVRLRGEIWRARSPTPVPRGASVRVREVNGLTLVVEPDGDGSAVS